MDGGVSRWARYNQHVRTDNNDRTEHPILVYGIEYVLYLIEGWAFEDLGQVERYKVSRWYSLQVGHE